MSKQEGEQIMGIMTLDHISNLNNSCFQGPIRNIRLPVTTTNYSLSSRILTISEKSLSPVNYDLVEGSLTKGHPPLTSQQEKLIQDYQLSHPLCKRGVAC